MIKMQLSQAAQAINGQLIGNSVEFIGAHNDTRSITAGNLFFAITGPNFDGHNFLEQAQQAGAVAAVVEHQVDVAIPQIIVADTTVAMGDLAKFWREQFPIPFIGITGSVGKTTTRQMVGAIMNQLGSTLISEGNKNNFYGVPLTLFRLGPEHQYAVIEMGADRPGDIRYLTQIVQPQIAMITMVAPTHLEVKKGIGFGTVEGILKEKSEIFSLLPEHGIAVINADSKFIDFWQQKLADFQRITFGYSANADVTATDLQPNDQMQYQFMLQSPIGKQKINLSAYGRHNVQNAMAASAVAIATGAELEDVKNGLADVPTVDHRMIIQRGFNNALVIDDSYNSSPVSANAVLQMLADYKDRKTIAVLGDMRELGNVSEKYHHELGEHAKALGVDYLLTYGPEIQATVAAYSDDDKAKNFATHDELIKFLKPLLDDNSVVVVKGSLAMQMKKVVQALID